MLARRSPLKRTGFARKPSGLGAVDSGSRSQVRKTWQAGSTAPSATMPQAAQDAEPVPFPHRAAVVAVRARYGPAPAASPVPKFPYVRDERFQEMCRGLACQHCGLAGPDAGVTWAHSNQGRHGHGRGVKASDEFVAAMCWICHRELDQGRLWSEAEKVAFWTAAYGRTVCAALTDGTWPAGFPIPLEFAS